MKAVARAHVPGVARLLGLGLSIVAIGFGGQLAWAWAQVSPRFSVKSIEVHGESRATAAELLKLCGLGEGQNIFGLDVPALERALSTHPWVKRATVARRFPSRVTVEVVEHEPAAVVSLGELYLVDAEGNPFKRLQPQDELDLTLITGLDRDAYVDRPFEARARILAALGVLAVSKPPPAEIRTSVHGLSIVTTDGLEVRLGAGDIELKLERLARIRKELQTRKLSAEVIRLDNRMRPTWVTVQLSGSSASPATASKK